VAERIGYRTLVTLAATADDRATTPEVAALIDAQLRALAGKLVRGDGLLAETARKLGDPAARAKLIEKQQRTVPIPPADPIGGEGGYMDW
jgi:hypothetical protein